MDDIICPECGRPNLGGAKKCWYCQSELIYSEVTSDDGKGGKLEKEFITTGHPEQEEDLPEEEIPEWLARIRHKIEEEREPEEELPYWKQKDIFGGEKKIDKKSQKEKRAHRSAKTKKENNKDVEDPLLEDPLNKNDNETEFEDLSNDLPDGFTSL